MKVYLGVPRGFCAGVVRAIDLVELALKKYGVPIYVKHQIVHNPHVVRELELKGAITVEDVEEIPRGSHVVFSAPGSPPEDIEIAKEIESNRMALFAGGAASRLTTTRCSRTGLDLRNQSLLRDAHLPHAGTSNPANQ